MDAHGVLLYVVAYNLRKVENREHTRHRFLFYFCRVRCVPHLRAEAAKQKEIKPKRRHAGLTQGLPRWRN